VKVYSTTLTQQTRFFFKLDKERVRVRYGIPYYCVNKDYKV